MMSIIATMSTFRSATALVSLAHVCQRGEKDLPDSHLFVSLSEGTYESSRELLLRIMARYTPYASVLDVDICPCHPDNTPTPSPACFLRLVKMFRVEASWRRVLLEIFS